MRRAEFDLSPRIDLPPGGREDARELPQSAYIPYTSFYDDATVRTKDDALMQVIQIDGLCFEAFDDEQLARFQSQRNTVLRAIATPHCSLFAYLIRRQATEYPEGDFSQSPWLACAFNDDWHAAIEARALYRNDYYLVLVRHRHRQGAIGWLDKAAQLLSGGSRTETLAEMADDLEKATAFLCRSLAEYGARRLDATAIFRFLDSLLYWRDSGGVPRDGEPLNRQLATCWLHADKGLLEVESLTHHRLGALLSLNEWPNPTHPRLLDGFLRLPCEFILTQSFSPKDRIAAEASLSRKERQMRQANDPAKRQIEAISEGLEAIAEGQISGLHHLTALVHVPVCESARRDLERAIEQMGEAFNSMQVVARREYFGAEPAYWGQLPGQPSGYLARRGTITSENFAGFMSLHGFASGKPSGNLWGPAIMLLESEAGTPCYFNFHAAHEGLVAGHTKVIGSTGSGKTALIAALVAQADKVRPRVFWFDRANGAEIFIRAMGGVYSTISPEHPSGWNPLQLDDTPDNRAFLLDWLGLLRTCYGGHLNASDIEVLRSAVEETYALPRADRRLSNIAWVFGRGDLAQALAPWHGDGANAGYFDNPTDKLDFGVSRHYGFEQGLLMRDAIGRPELPVVLSYLMHRIDLALDGTPTILVVDEAQVPIAHPYWRARLENWLMTIRRKNGIVVLMTPDAKYFYAGSDVIKKQCVTSLYLPTPEADRRDYVEGLDSTIPEYEFIRDTLPASRTFLLRQGRQSYRVRFDLSELPDWIPVFSGSAATVRLMREAIEQAGEQPEAWLPRFTEQARALNTHNAKGT